MQELNLDFRIYSEEKKTETWEQNSEHNLIAIQQFYYLLKPWCQPTYLVLRSPRFLWRA